MKFTNLETLEMKHLESIDGGIDLSDSSTWGSVADLSSALFPTILGRSTFLGYMNSHVDVYMQSANDRINGYNRIY